MLIERKLTCSCNKASQFPGKEKLTISEVIFTEGMYLNRKKIQWNQQKKLAELINEFSKVAR